MVTELMGTFTSIRKAYGALKDSTKVGLAKVNSEYKDLDVAIVKATNHVEYPPKERHVRKIFYATAAHQPRADVAYCIHALSKRLSKTRSWIVAIKTLIVIHRILREGDPTFREELLNYTRRGHVLQIANFKDDSSPLAWDCSAWVRAYALFLEERLECFRVLSYDIESDRLRKSSSSMAKTPSRARELEGDEMLQKLPALQQLLYRLIGCQPEGAAYCNQLVQYALILVLKESFKIYCAINDGIVTLVDLFFDMPRHDAIKVLNIYKRSGQQAENLAVFYEYCKGLDVARNFQFPSLKQPPPTFLSTMEEYIKEAPQTSSANMRLEYQEYDRSSQKEEPEEVKEMEEHKQREENKEKQSSSSSSEEEEKQTKEEKADPPPLVSTDAVDDLLGLNEMGKLHEFEESNALALAIIPPDGNAPSTNHSLNNIMGTSGWELALVSTPTNSISQAPTDHKMGGGFDKFLLDSLYEDENARRQLQLQNAGYGPGGMAMQNQYNQQQSYINHSQNDPFAMSNNIAPPANVRMAQQQQQMMFQQQQMMFQQQQQQQRQMMFPQQQQQQHNMMMSHGHGQDTQNQYPQHMQVTDYSNPFGDSIPASAYPHNSMPQRGNYNLI